ncbi:hypothetical protein VUS55_28400, partial [Pseudomonas aeruginosa]|uniref:hypothetical protein n=1 Tax=Pseudomonas aeruginosa TaxID=287 RepID=UPI003007E78A
LGQISIGRVGQFSISANSLRDDGFLHSPQNNAWSSISHLVPASFDTTEIATMPSLPFLGR